MTSRARWPILVLGLAAAPAAHGEACTATATAPWLSPASPFGKLQPPVLAPSVPGWLYTFDGGPFEFDVRLTLRKVDDDGGPPCRFRVGSSILATIEITNLSEQRFATYFSGNGRFWDIYLYDATDASLATRLSYGQGYDDDRYWADIAPGATLTETRLWRPDGINAPFLPAGVYRAYGRFEPDYASPPQFTRSDTTLAPALTIGFTDD